MPRGDGSYTYWDDGSLRSDANEGIDNISYDTYLKQPTEVFLTGGRRIKNIYDGSGHLFKTIYYDDDATNTVLETWEYVGGTGGVPLVLKDGQPYQLTTSEGRAIYQYGNWLSEFDYKDHLGNTRVSFKASGSQASKTAETAFDPWGVRLNGIGSVNGFQNRWEMQGKEKESTFGMNRISFGARTYNPTIRRFDRIDPLVNQREWLTPYNFVQNNSINRTDPTGMLDDYTTKQDGSIDVVKTNDKFDRFLIENKEQKVEFVTQIDKNENGLLNLPSKIDFKSSDPESSFNLTLKEGNGYRSYIRGDAAAALFGAASETNFKDLGVVGFSLSDGTSPKPSTSHKLGKNGDLRYLNTNENGAGSNTKNSDFDVKRNSILTNALFKYGWKDIISEKFGNGQLLPNTSSSKERGISSDHTTHLHLQGFNPKLIRR